MGRAPSCSGEGEARCGFVSALLIGAGSRIPCKLFLGLSVRCAALHCAVYILIVLFTSRNFLAVFGIPYIFTSFMQISPKLL